MKNLILVLSLFVFSNTEAAQFSSFPANKHGHSAFTQVIKKQGLHMVYGGADISKNPKVVTHSIA